MNLANFGYANLGIHFSRIIQNYRKFANCDIKAIFSIVYNISQPDFAILLRLGCSFKLW